MKSSLSFLLPVISLILTANGHAATFDVTSTAGTGPGTLAQAVADANASVGADTILFAPAIAGQTITMTTAITVTSGIITINGETNTVGMVLDGALTVRHFSVDAGAELNLYGLNLTRGQDTSGAGSVENSGYFTATRCSFYGNNGSYGGAVATYGADARMEFTHCTFQGNQASQNGGALHISGSDVKITHCTITGNTAFEYGGGVNSAGKLALKGSIISQNTAPNGADLYAEFATSYTRSGQNIVRQVVGIAGTGPAVLNVDPQLAALGNYGGHTLTCPPLPTSPAIDPVDGETTTDFNSDQRFYPRLSNANSQPGFTVDIGSVETVTRVSSGNNSSTSSIRGILRGLPGGFTVDFSSAFSGAFVNLGDTELVITRSVTVNAVDLERPVGFLTDNIARHIRIVPGITVTLRALQFASGGGRGGVEDGSGGAIFNQGSLILEYCAFIGNRANFNTNSRGGAIFSRGPLCQMDSCTFSGNISASTGGAVYSRTNLTGDRTTFNQCTLHGNTATGAGGAIYNFDGLTEVESCTITGNTSSTSAGGGIASFGDAGTETKIKQSIVCENSGEDLAFVVGLLNSFTSLGYNFVGSGTGIGDINATGDTTGNTDAQLAPLGSYGGLNSTRPPLPGSPVIDKIPATGGFALDQRFVLRERDGDSNPGTESDIGSTEAPTLAENSAGSVSFERVFYTATESEGTAQIRLVRTGGLRGSISVGVSSSGGTATAVTDYEPLVGERVTFAHNQDTAILPITLVSDPSVREQHETVNLTLSTPAGGATLGSRTTSLLYILDAFDPVKPTIAITAPAANTVYQEGAGATLLLTGTARDDKGLETVNVRRVNSGPVVFSTTQTFSNGLKDIAWSSTVSLVPGVNTFEVEAIDSRGNVSAIVRRSFTFDVVRTLTVSVSGPANSGTVSAGFVPTSQRKSGLPYRITATPRPGFVFSGWTGVNLAAAGITGSLAELPTLNFTMTDGLVLVANFIATPFPAVAGVFHGLLEPDGSTAISNAAAGHLSITLSTTGTFTGSLRQDGGTHPVNGLLWVDGNARFGTTRGTELFISRPGKEPIYVALTLALASSPRFMTASVTHGDVTTSGTLGRGHFSATNKVPAGYAGTTGQRYHFITTNDPNGNTGLNSNKFPQGHSACSLVLTTSGGVTCAGTLADGTTITGSGPLWENRIFPLYTPLYGNKGCFASPLQLDTTPANSDLTGQYVFWLRPAQTGVQWYPDGWPSNLEVNITGTKYLVPTSEALIAGLSPVNATSGNVMLQFTQGLINGLIDKRANITTAQVITRAPTTDTTFTATLAKATGILSGTFPHSDGLTKPAYTSIILKKGAVNQAYGHFLTVSPRVRNGLGEAGKAVVLLRE